MSLLTSGQLLPEAFVERLLQASPSELAQEPFGSLLLLVRLPAKPPRDFAEALQPLTLRGGARAQLPGTVWTTTEVPTVQQDLDQELGPDQISLLAELESSAHCAVPLAPAGSALRIGRARSSAIVLRDDSVSQTHAKIVPLEDGTELHDLQSKNGTWVNGSRLAPGTRRWLQPMDRLQFGRIQAFTCTVLVLRSVLRHRLRQLL